MKIPADMVVLYKYALNCHTYNSWSLSFGMTSDSLVDHYQPFTGAYCLHHQDRRMTIKATCSSKTLIRIHQFIRRHVTNEINAHSNLRENLNLQRTQVCTLDLHVN